MLRHNYLSSKHFKYFVKAKILLPYLAICVFGYYGSNIIIWGAGLPNLTRNLVMLFLGFPLILHFINVKEKSKFMIYLMVFLLPVSTYVMPPGRFGFNLFEFLLVVLGVMWFHEKIMPREKIFRKTPLNKPLIFLFASALLSSFFAHDPGASFYSLLLYLRFYLFYAIFVDVIDDYRDLRVIMCCLAIGVILLAVMGISQSYFGINFAIYKTLNPNSKFTMGDQTLIRVVGPFFNSLNFANYLSVCIFFLFYFLIYNKRKLVIITVSVLIIVVMYCIFETASRVAAFSTLFLFIMMTLLLVKKLLVRNIGVVKIIVSLFILLLLTYSLSGILMEKVKTRGLYLRIQNAEIYGSQSRLNMWKLMGPILSSSILTGAGLRNSYSGTGWKLITKIHHISWGIQGPFYYHFESVYLAILANLGLIGLIAFCYLIYIVIKTICIIFIKTTVPEEKKNIIVLSFAWLSMLLNMTVNPAVLSDYRIMLLFWLLLALTVVNNKLSTVYVRSFPPLARRI